MAEVSDEQLQTLAEEAFAAGQEHMRTSAATRARMLIGIETGGRELRLAETVGDHISQIKIRTLAEARKLRSQEPSNDG